MTNSLGAQSFTSSTVCSVLEDSELTGRFQELESLVLDGGAGASHLGVHAAVEDNARDACCLYKSIAKVCQHLFGLLVVT